MSSAAILLGVLGLSAKQLMTKFTSAKILIIVFTSCIILRIQRLGDNVDPDEAAASSRSALFANSFFFITGT